MAEAHTEAVVITVSKSDIDSLNSGCSVETDTVFIIPKDKMGEIDPHDTKLSITMSQNALDNVRNNQSVTYGILKFNGKLKEVFVRRGKVADYIGESERPNGVMPE